MLKPKKRKRALRRRGSLGLIAFFLIASGSLRIGIGASEAFAKTEAVDNSAPALDAPLANCEPPKDIATVLRALEKREKQLAQNEEAFRDRMQALSVADSVVEKKLTELVAAEEALRNSIAKAEVASENDVTKLTTVYENMKPQDAAALFEEMDPEFAAGFLGRMRPEAAAGVMAGLLPTTAYTISVVLAGRNANVPTE